MIIDRTKLGLGFAAFFLLAALGHLVPGVTSFLALWPAGWQAVLVAAGTVCVGLVFGAIGVVIAVRILHPPPARPGLGPVASGPIAKPDFVRYGVIILVPSAIIAAIPVVILGSGTQMEPAALAIGLMLFLAITAFAWMALAITVSLVAIIVVPFALAIGKVIDDRD